MENNVIKYLNKLLKSKDKSIFDIDVIKDKAYLNSFKEPKDDIERSYFQYCCQKKDESFFKKFYLNIGAVFIFIKLLVSKLKQKKIKYKCSVYISFPKEQDDFKKIPTELLLEKKYCCYQTELFSWNKDVSVYIKKIFKRYPFSFYFWIKVLYVLTTRIQQGIDMKASTIICSSEYSFTSSCLTDYVEKHKCKLVNIQHGEKLFVIRDSFFRFSKFYIWDLFYKDLFHELRCSKEIEFIKFVPECLKFDISCPASKKYDYCYALQDESKDEIIKIQKTIDMLINKGFSICYREHPLYLLTENQKNKFNCDDVTKIDLQNVANSVKGFISLYSTVLYQAKISNLAYVIDDYSCNFKFKKLQELQYNLVKEKNILTINNLLK